MAFSWTMVGARVVVDLGDDARLAGDVLHHEVVGGDAAQRHRVGRVALARPVPALSRAVQQVLALEVAQDLAQVFLAEALVVGEGQLEGRALHVGEEDLEVVGVDAALLGGGPEEVVGVLGDELVQGRRVGHQHRHRGRAAAAGAPRLLPGRGHAARIAQEHRRHRGCRCRCPARGRSWRRRPGRSPRAGRARSRAASGAGSRRDTRG